MTVLWLYARIFRHISVRVWMIGHYTFIREGGGFALRSLFKWNYVDPVHVYPLQICRIKRLFLTRWRPGSCLLNFKGALSRRRGSSVDKIRIFWSTVCRWCWSIAAAVACLFPRNSSSHTDTAALLAWWMWARTERSSRFPHRDHESLIGVIAFR